MVKIYLVRHAQSTGNLEKRLTGRADYSLTLDGKKQVEKLSESLKDIRFDAFFSSPSKRAIDTIKVLSVMNNKEIEIKDGLSEMYFGIFDGLKWEEVNRINPIIHKKHQETNEIMEIPDQESTKEVAERMHKTISEIATKHTGETILISSHGVAIEAFLRKVTQEPFVQKREEYSQKNTSVNILQYDESKKEYELMLLNSIQHLN